MGPLIGRISSASRLRASTSFGFVSSHPTPLNRASAISLNGTSYPCTPKSRMKSINKWASYSNELSYSMLLTNATAGRNSARKQAKEINARTGLCFHANKQQRQSASAVPKKVTKTENELSCILRCILNFSGY
jgi:Tfp pilus assembly protein PilN